MATTTRKTTARKPADHLTKAPTAAERLRAEAEGGEGPFEITVGGETFAVKDPLDWDPTATETLLSGSWISWASSALADSADYRAFVSALSSTTTRETLGVRRDVVRRGVQAAQAMGEGDGS